MARILVTGKSSGIAGMDLLRRITTQMRDDGHDAVVLVEAEEDPQKSILECDALVAILDDAGPPACTAVAYAASLQKPVLGLSSEGHDCGPLLRRLCDVQVATSFDGWSTHFEAFYEKIRPFAGRVVRDRIPQLVKEAGHQVKFRELTGEEKPRFLKQKVAHEASELRKADLAKEKEEVADVLEALEAFILARGFDRDDLRRVKEAKKKRRGGFERCFVVEATSQELDAEPAAAEPAEATESATETATSATSTEAPATEPTTPEKTESPEAPQASVLPGFEYPEEDPEPAVEQPENLAPDQEVKSRFFEV